MLDADRLMGRSCYQRGKEEEWVEKFWEIARFIISGVHVPRINLSEEEGCECGCLPKQARRAAKR